VKKASGDRIAYHLTDQVFFIAIFLGVLVDDLKVFFFNCIQDIFAREKVRVVVRHLVVAGVKVKVRVLLRVVAFCVVADGALYLLVFKGLGSDVCGGYLPGFVAVAKDYFVEGLRLVGGLAVLVGEKLVVDGGFVFKLPELGVGGVFGFVEVDAGVDFAELDLVSSPSAVVADKLLEEEVLVGMVCY